MKKLSVLVIAIMASASAWAQMAMGNSKINVDFSKYKTFTWAHSGTTGTGDAEGVDVNGVITDAIYNELEGRGYRETPGRSDLIVVYHVLEAKAKLHGYKDDYPAFTGGRKVRQPSDTVTFYLEPGALVVNLVDAKTDEAVWTGFEYGMSYENEAVIDEVLLREEVHSIFDKFKYTADKSGRN